MLNNLVDKFGNKEKIILSIIGAVASILGGISVAVLFQNIWAIVIALVGVGGFNLCLDMYDEAKKNYCYELSNNYFEKNKDSINKDKELDNIRILSKINNFCSTLQIGLLPTLVLLFMLLLAFGISLPIALDICGYTCVSILAVTLTSMGYTDFYIDVLCEVVEKVKDYENQNALVVQEDDFKEKLAKALRLNPGISKNRYKYDPGISAGSDIHIDELVDLGASLECYRGKSRRLCRTDSRDK